MMKTISEYSPTGNASIYHEADNDDVSKLYCLKGLFIILAWTGLNSGSLALLLKFGVFASNAFGMFGSCFLIML